LGGDWRVELAVLPLQGPQKEAGEVQPSLSSRSLAGVQVYSVETFGDVARCDLIERQLVQARKVFRRGQIQRVQLLSLRTSFACRQRQILRNGVGEDQRGLALGFTLASRIDAFGDLAEHRQRLLARGVCAELGSI